MLTFLAMYGPDSAFGWVVLLFIASLPIVAVCALILAVFVGVTRAALARNRPPDAPGQGSVSSDPEATASRLRASAQDRRGRPRNNDPAD